MADKNNSPIIIKREEGGGGGGHHGGAWKVAYADFMTAMMAFFLLMWLLNVTTDEQRRGIALFFNPMADKSGTASFAQSIQKTSPVSSPSSAVKDSDHEPNDEQGKEESKAEGKEETKATEHEQHGVENSTSMGMSILPSATNSFSQGIKADVPPQPPAVIPLGGPQSGASQKEGQVGQGNADRVEQTADENRKLQEMVQQLQEEVKKNDSLTDHQKNLSFKVGSDEIRIEMQDTEHQSMFNTGAIAPNKAGVAMLTEIAKWLSTLPENISIIGKTDGVPYHTRKSASNGALSNWTLSAMRADKAREVLVRAGYPDRKIESVTGQADRNLTVPAQPEAAENRRIVLVIHRRYPLPASFASASPQPSGDGATQGAAHK